MYYLQHVGLIPAWFHLVPAARGIVFAAHEAGSMLRYMCHLQHVGLVPLGSMLQCMCYLQHVGLVPAWFRLVPLVKGLFLQHAGSVP